MRVSFFSVVAVLLLGTACRSGTARVVAPVTRSAVEAKHGDGGAATCPPPQQTTLAERCAPPGADDDPEVLGALLAAESRVVHAVREAAVASVVFSGREGFADDDARSAAIEAAAAEVDERARCLDVGFASHARLDADTVFFSGSIPTDAGGIGDGATWGVLVVRVSCAWAMVDIGLRGSELSLYHSPRGERLYMQTNVTEQCSATTRVFAVRDARPEVLASFVGPRSDMDGVCGEQLRVELDTEGDVLRGYRLLEHQGEGGDVWTVQEQRVWREGRYVLGR